MRIRARAAELLKHLIMLLVVVVIVFPVLWMFTTAVQAPQDLFGQGVGLIPRNPTLMNFKAILKDAPFSSWLKNTIIVTVGIVGFRMLTATMAAFGFAFFDFRGKNLLFTSVIGTMMIPFAITMIPNYIMISSIGLLDRLGGVVLPYIASGFGIFFLRQHMKSLPVSFFEAAKIDGASDLQTLYLVILPIIKGPVLALTIWHVIEAWNMFFWPMLVLRDQTKQTLPIAMLHFQDPEAGMFWGKLMALATLISLPTLITYMIARKQIIETSVSAGVKG